MRSKKFWVQKKFKFQRNIRSKKYLVQKKLCLKNLGLKNCWGKKIVCGPKKLWLKKLGLKKIWGLKKILVKKKIKVRNNAICSGEFCKSNAKM